MPEDPYAYVVDAFQALPPPDYVPGPEEPEQAPPSLIYITYVPKPVYPEYIPLEDDDDDDEDPKEDLANYRADHDEEEEEPSGDDADEEDEEPQPPTLSFTKEDAERFLAMPIPPPSPLTPLSSPLQQIPSPPLPTSPHILLIPLPAASPPLQLLLFDRRADRPEDEIRQRRAENIGYGIRDTWIDPRDVAEEVALTTLEGVNIRVIELAAVQEQDTQDIYRVMEDTQGRQTEIFQRVKALVDDIHFELQGYMTHTWVQDHRIDAQDTLIATLTIQLSSLQGHLATALGEIRALQAKEQARAENGTKESGPKKTTRLNPCATPNPNQAPSTTTTTVTNAQLQAMIDQGVNAALAVRDANRIGDDSYTSGTGVRRTEHVT
uniref:Reverse transcriptase domain-containing protein n=1 Tax=Tanacetum cinerariifolium TaxID=118510 RepID=A0A699JUM0_TANCI|nr:hypothetical protein [Tanacetum cinerariifolium]